MLKRLYNAFFSRSRSQSPTVMVDVRVKHTVYIVSLKSLSSSPSHPTAPVPQKQPELRGKNFSKPKFMVCVMSLIQI